MSSSSKAWVDVLTPKQVLFFNPIVRELRESGCHVLVTSRRYREVEPLARMVGMEMRYVGERAEKGRMAQLVADTRRQAELIPLVEDFGPDVAVSVASGTCARVAFGMGVRHIAVNDSPHSEIAGRLSLPFSHRLLCPWVIPFSAWSKFGITRTQITRYRALDPVAWLRREPTNGPIPDLPSGRKTIVVRIEESDAPYLAGSEDNWVDAVLEGIGKEFTNCNLVALTRYGHQLEQIRRLHGAKFIVPEQVVDGRRLIGESDLLIGMGGTMTAEAALSGVPVISAFQGSYFVEEYLRSKGLLVKANQVKTLLIAARRLLDDKFRVAYSKRAKRAFDSMEDPVPKVSRSILKTIGSV